MADQGFTLTSPEFEHGGLYPAGRTRDSENSSPELHWTHPPSGCQSYVLILDDPDAPRRTFTYWVLFDIPAETRQLPSNEITVGTPGKNDFNDDAYGGPCPPPDGKPHRYYFRLYALDIPRLNLPRGAERRQVEEAMKGHVLATAELMARYSRGTERQ